MGEGLGHPAPPRADSSPRRPPVRGLSRVRVHAACPAGLEEDGLQPGHAGEGPPGAAGLRVFVPSLPALLLAQRPLMALIILGAFWALLSPGPEHPFRRPAHWLQPQLTGHFSLAPTKPDAEGESPS